MGSDGRGSSSALSRPARQQAGHSPVSDLSPELNLDWTQNLVESYFAGREAEHERARGSLQSAG